MRRSTPGCGPAICPLSQCPGLRSGQPAFPNSTALITTDPSEVYSARRTRGLIALGMGFQLALDPRVLLHPGHMRGARRAMGRSVEQEEFFPEYEGDHKDVLEWAFPLLREILSYYKGPGSPRPVITSPVWDAATGGEPPSTPGPSTRGPDGGTSDPPRGSLSRPREPRGISPEAGKKLMGSTLSLASAGLGRRKGVELPRGEGRVDSYTGIHEGLLDQSNPARVPVYLKLSAHN